MRYRMTLLAMIFVVFAGSLLAQRRIDEPLRPESAPLWRCQRIVSMAPSITETLYALGLGNRVVGVTRDCKYPPEVERVRHGKGNIGGYYDTNFEAILALKPDLVIMLEEQADSLPGLVKLKLETLTVSHKTVDGIIESFRTIGRVCGAGTKGRRMAQDFRNRLDRIEQQTRMFARPRVMIALDRILDCGHLADVYIAGVDDYFDRIIELAGGQNVYRHRGVRYPVVSPEGILRLNPDVIVDLVRSESVRKFGRQAILDHWNDVRTVNAVKGRRVLIFDRDYDFVPGPRFILLVEQLARALHPEMNLENW
jgi:iron complex transport system substrate-binding protein